LDETLIEQVLPSQTMKYLPDYVKPEVFPKQEFSFLFTAASSDTLDLLSKTLVFDPSKRITASEALLHPYFSNAPAPTHHTKLPAKASNSSADNDKTADHPLLSDSGVKNARRQGAVGEVATKRGLGGPNASARPGGAKRQLREEDIAERKRIARKLAFG